ncbi:MULTISPECIES: F420-0:Gamma-glutamyl ligase [unclassified Thermosynechococcus]|uniref:F420-0:Gamma-glutamyl ligase n=1 Tax=unclassified Thermosynechococcus TaxID=2622553 RepID=UPI00197DC9E6|nr:MULTISPECIES: F420-0:Gamma-glutamyl ligase [unclassified Thermosynechococcus]QSF48738.1 F420-0:Gamma-glutamyl ligase [Thermosynechococcus sp. TA-1]WNC21785.1 F420-0:Gamma-glutamyl ligase [Thermosynechococcus sp. PP22]
MIATVIGIGAAALGFLALLVAIGLEGRYRQRPAHPLEVIRATWNLEIYEPTHYRFVGLLGLSNPHRGLEVMVPDLRAEVVLLSDGRVDMIQTDVQVIPRHPEPEFLPRADGYWFAYIVKSTKQTNVEICVDLQGIGVSEVKAAWVKIHYIAYGPHGRFAKTHHEFIPLKFPATGDTGVWRQAERCQVLPIRTHLLTPLDIPLEVLNRYVMPHAQPGDIVAIGETPLAIIQGRLKDPAQMQPGWVATRVCQFFLPTSSLATACGMQALVEEVGALRVLLAFLGGAIAKVFGHKGGFYQLAGEQARLIDDVTGTLPPYDQFIVMGPVNPQAVVEDLAAKTGLGIAIVDVNDLGAVKVLAASQGVSPHFLTTALKKNPAGNADEQTPIVLIRPCGVSPSSTEGFLDKMH